MNATVHCVSERDSENPTKGSEKAAGGQGNAASRRMRAAGSTEFLGAHPSVRRPPKTTLPRMRYDEHKVQSGTHVQRVQREEETGHARGRTGKPQLRQESVDDRDGKL